MLAVRKLHGMDGSTAMQTTAELSGLGEEECENKVRKRLRLLEGGEEGVVPGGVS